MARPDTALVHLGAETRAPRLADATADVTRRMTEVMKRLETLGVPAEDVTTVQYIMNPIPTRRGPDGDEHAPEVAGYHVANIARIRVRDLSAVSRVVDAAAAAGANTIRDIRFVIANPATAESAARHQAVEAARAAAEEIARAAGVRLGPLLALREGQRCGRPSGACPLPHCTPARRGPSPPAS